MRRLLPVLLASSLAVSATSARADDPPPFDGPADLQIGGVTATNGLAAADFTGDGRQDLALVSLDNARLMIVVQNRNQPSGPGGQESRFAVACDVDAGASAGDVVVADFDEDGRPDVAVPHHDTAEVWVFSGNGDGTVGSPRKISVAAKKPHSHALVAADANRDRHVDLLLAQADDNQLWVLLGDGKGGFAPASTSPMATGNHPYGSALADFNGDAHPDLATPNWYGKTISVFLADGRGGFRPGPGSPIGGLTAPTALGAGDLNGDGHPDLAVGQDDASKVLLLAGDGKGGFAAGKLANLEARGPCFSPILADLNGDGRLDALATSQNHAPTFSYWLNQGAGRFSPANPLPCPPLATDICVADLNGDRLADVAVGTWKEPKIYVWFGKKPSR
jgi:hypothetical protein